MKSENDIQTIYNPRSNTRTQNVNVKCKGMPHRNASKDGSCHSEEMGDILREEASSELAGKKRSCKSKLQKLSRACCSPSAIKIYCGIWVTVCITASWVTSTHFLKYLYQSYSVVTVYNVSDVPQYVNQMGFYHAPFFTTWFFTNWTILFFPIYYCMQLASSRALTPLEILCDSVKNFRNCRFTAGRFLMRCSIFCIVWVFTNYMFVTSLRYLLATDAIALFATNVAFSYLLSWVFLHEQFVGLRIVAIILSATGVALLAYMDGTTANKNKTLKSVLLTAGAATGYAVHKVFFKKTFGNATLGQISLFFSLVGMLNAILLWPICLVFYFTGVEVIHWDKIPWFVLFGTSFFTLITHVLMNFSRAITYDLFVSLGLITSVPVSAALDIALYGTNFYGMNLSGIVLISVGFFLVMFPANWPDYITRLLRMIILMSRNARWNRRNRKGQSPNQPGDTDYRTGYIRSHLRSPSGRVR